MKAPNSNVGIAVLLMILVICAGCVSSPDSIISSSPTPLPLSGLETTANIGNVSVTVLKAYYWRDWMPEVQHPGPDGGSPLLAKIQIRLNNSGGNDGNLSFTTVVYDQERRSHPVIFHVIPDQNGNVWSGSLAAGESKVIQILTNEGPYSPVGSKITTVITWTDQDDNSVSVITPEIGIERTE